MTDFSDQFRKIIMRYKRIGYNLNVMRQSACLVINPITVDDYATLFNCTPVDRASVAWSTKAQLIIFFCFRFSVVLFYRPGISIRNATHLYLSSPRLCFFIVISLDLSVDREDSLTS